MHAQCMEPQCLIFANSSQPAQRTTPVSQPCQHHALSHLHGAQEEAELTEGEYELEDELEDMEDLAEAAGQEADSEEDADDSGEDADPQAAAEQAGRQRKAPISGAAGLAVMTPARGLAVGCLGGSSFVLGVGMKGCGGSGVAV